jgi:hypothetical protein
MRLSAVATTASSRDRGCHPRRRSAFVLVALRMFPSKGTSGRTDALNWPSKRISQSGSCRVGNALKYGAGNPVRVTLDGNGATVKTIVRDEGIGIEPSAQPRMFDRFERAVSVRNYSGFGLGLRTR